MSDPGTLSRLAVEAGLSEGEVGDVLASDQFAQEVRADEAHAQKLGISGVPCFVLDERYAISGAQPAPLILSALHQAFAEREPSPEPAEGAVCGPDGC
jgi:predicted DsbA family dithiol-disulfide isomerase